MTEQEENLYTETEEAPIIPPNVLLGIAVAGLIIALSILLIQASFGVIGYGALFISLLSLISLIFVAPRAVVDVLTGRSLRFGGTSILITIVFLGALIAIYVVVSQQDWSLDLTETDQFSLNEEAETAMVQFGNDPLIPAVEILAFYNATQLNQQEQYTLLLDDYVAASDGKITYEFINPDRNPALAQQLGITGGQLVVVAPDETGERDLENSEIVNAQFNVNQNQLTNAILRVAASGEFNAYFLNVTDGLSIEDTSQTGISDLVTILEDRLRWTVAEPTYIELNSPESEIELNNSNIDGEVMVIVGGSQTLNDEEAQFIVDYVDGGGNLVIFAAPEFEGEALASTELLNTYLLENFGIRFNNDIVLDPQEAFQSPEVPLVSNFDRSNYITQSVAGQGDMLMPLTRTIEVADEVPENVRTWSLLQTSDASYSKTVEELINEEVQADDDDPEGPFAVAAAAENSETGARVVLFGSQQVASNQWALFQGLVNQQVAFNALVWTTNYNDFFETLPQVAPFDQRPQDAPVFADAGQVRLINFISILALPFGVLAIGAGVWAARRQNA